MSSSFQSLDLAWYRSCVSWCGKNFTMIGLMHYFLCSLCVISISMSKLVISSSISSASSLVLHLF